MEAFFPLPGRHAEYLEWLESGAGRFHWPFTEVEHSLLDAWEEWRTNWKEALDKKRTSTSPTLGDEPSGEER